jgi:hypothetical protein
LTPSWAALLRPWIEQGGMLLLVPAEQEAATSLPIFFDDVEVKGAEKVRDDHYLLLGDINFSHPLFAPFASPRYSDFTKVHFWKHRPLSLHTPATTSVVARFDNGDPAILERTLGQGRILAFVSGWQPDDSQLALSSKFVPLMGGILDLACGGAATPASVSIGAPVPLSPSQTSSTTIFAPDGREVPVAAGAATFTATDQPGIYRVIASAAETRFAVNLPAAESDTAPLDAEQLEQRGVASAAGSRGPSGSSACGSSATRNSRAGRKCGCG